jgi:formylglycine-generating enzyme required for sulfatase activity
MGSNPSYFKNCGGDCPVEQVSWNDIKIFIRSLNALQSDYRFRLPSEAEWTYARLGGAKTVWSFGDDESDLVDYAWFSSNSNDKTHPVGQKKPNDYGLYDMYGNVQEWCEDINSDHYNKLPADGSANTNIGDSRFRVLRGGHYTDNSSVVNYYRFWFTPNERVAHSGFRIAASVQ